jgi:predicted nucleic acid-binding protein
MTITVDISPEVQAELARQAAAQGRALEAYAAVLLEEAAHIPAGDTAPPSGTSQKPAQAKNLVDLFEPIRGLLSDEEIDVMFSRNPSTGRPVDLSWAEVFCLIQTFLPSWFALVQTLRVQNWVSAKDEQSLYLSAVSIGEFRRGIVILPAGRRRLELEQWLENDLGPRFRGRILPVTQSVANRWGILDGECQLRGTARATADGMIAATALEHDLTLVTRNVKDFAGIPVTIFNPWDAEWQGASPPRPGAPCKKCYRHLATLWLCVSSLFWYLLRW